MADEEGRRRRAVRWEPADEGGTAEDDGGGTAEDDEEMDRLSERQGSLLRLARQLGGAVTAIAVEGRHAYVGKGYRLLVLDLADPARPAIVGHSLTLEAMVQEVIVQGDLAVVATFLGVHLFDVGDPAAPVQRSHLRVHMEGGGIALLFPYLTVACYTVEADAPGEGDVTITLDISDPANPRRLAIAARGYNEIELSGKLSGSRHYRAFGEELQIYDLEDPLRPRRIGTAALPEVIESAIAVGRYAYVAARDGFHVLDCADAAQPAPCFYFMTGTDAQQVLLSGQTACVVCAFGGVYTFDIGDPAVPRPLAHFGCSDYIETAAAGDGFLYLAAAGPPPSVGTVWTKYGIRERGFLVVDIRDPRRPTATPVDLGLFHADAAAVSGDRAYVIDGRDAYAGLRSLDLSRECDMGERSWIALERPSSALAASGNLVYVGTGGLDIYDFADPERPVRRGAYRTDKPVIDLALHGRAAYLAAEDGLHVVSVANPARPRRLAHLELPGPPVDIAVLDGRILLLLEHELRLLRRRGGQFTLLGRWESDDELNSVAVWGTSAVIGGSDGVHVVDVREPTRPRLLTTRRIAAGPGMAKDLITVGRYALFRDWDGIYMLDLADSIRPRLVDAYLTWDHAELIPNQLGTDGVRCLVAAQESGLLLLETGNPT